MGVKSTIILVAILSLVCIVYYIEYSQPLFEVKSEEILRLPSPDKQTDAVILQVDGGATTPIVYEIYVVPSQKEIDREEDDFFCVFQASNIDYELKWVNAKFLEIKYTLARIYKFRNHISPLEDPRYVVEVRETPKMPADSALPALYR